MTDANKGMGMDTGMGTDMHIGDGMHMTFFWGKNVQVLFSGWPGRRPGAGAYILALFLVFALAAVVELLAYAARRLESAGRRAHGGGARLCGGLVQTSVHALRVGLAYVVMLAVMSFNVGVLLVAVAGHALGFFLSGSCLPPPNDKS